MAVYTGQLLRSLKQAAEQRLPPQKKIISITKTNMQASTSRIDICAIAHRAYLALVYAPCVIVVAATMTTFTLEMTTLAAFVATWFQLMATITVLATCIILIISMVYLNKHIETLFRIPFMCLVLYLFALAMVQIVNTNSNSDKENTMAATTLFTSAHALFLFLSCLLAAHATRQYYTTTKLHVTREMDITTTTPEVRIEMEEEEEEENYNVMDASKQTEIAAAAPTSVQYAPLPTQEEATTLIPVLATQYAPLPSPSVQTTTTTTTTCSEDCTSNNNNIEFKKAPEEIIAANIAPQSSQQQQQQHLSILVAEDNEINLKVMVAMLKKLGILQIIVARNGREAVEQFQQAPKCHVIFMDIMMPEMNGISAAQEIRNHVQCKQPMIIALTASPQKEIEEQCMQAGMNQIMSKPFKLADLQRVLLEVATSKS